MQVCCISPTFEGLRHYHVPDPCILPMTSSSHSDLANIAMKSHSCLIRYVFMCKSQALGAARVCVTACCNRALVNGYVVLKIIGTSFPFKRDLFVLHQRRCFYFPVRLRRSCFGKSAVCVWQLPPSAGDNVVESHATREDDTLNLCTSCVSCTQRAWQSCCCSSF